MSPKKPFRLSTSTELRRLAQTLWTERSPMRREQNQDAMVLFNTLEVARVEAELRNGDLKAAYNDVWRSLERYTDLYDYAPVAYLTVLANGRICEANFASALLLGVDQPQLVGRSLLDLVELDSLAPFMVYLEELSGSQTAGRRLAFSLRRPDGRRLQVLASGICGRSLESAESCIQLALVDITEFAASNGHLRSERDRESTHFEAAGVLLMVLGPDGRIDRINRRGLELLGCSREFALGKDWFTTFLSPRTGRTLRKEFKMKAGTAPKEGPARQVSVRRADGTDLLMRLRESALMDPEAMLLGYVLAGDEESDDTSIQ